jgi:hypothetical protein
MGNFTKIIFDTNKAKSIFPKVRIATYYSGTQAAKCHGQRDLGLFDEGYCFINELKVARLLGHLPNRIRPIHCQVEAYNNI